MEKAMEIGVFLTLTINNNFLGILNLYISKYGFTIIKNKHCKRVAAEYIY